MSESSRIVYASRDRMLEQLEVARARFYNSTADLLAPAANLADDMFSEVMGGVETRINTEADDLCTRLEKELTEEKERLLESIREARDALWIDDTEEAYGTLSDVLIEEER